MSEARRVWNPATKGRGMRFGDLRRMSLDDYVASAPRDAFWFFLHIPKTAGSSFSTELSRVVKPYHNIHADAAQRGIGYDAAVNLALDEFLARPDLQGFRSASGHLLHPMTRKMWEHVPGMEMVTFLRDPEARVVSDYRYQRTPMHPGHEAFRQRFPTLESFVEDPASQNRIAHFIGDVRADHAELMARLERDFAFVGLVEMYPFSFSTLFALMGHPGHTPRERVRATPDTPETAVELTPRLRRRIAEVNSLDSDLVARTREILMPHAEAWQAARAD
ncbi:sulfotransferase family 2 domain-containing protein [Paracoccus sp. S-4012]|uniref:sulfotransferase family 2 domain-containing protein n=1 Tax=Paracoccus sp. S-4012 TaxID=2665648 RepID=UPI0018A2466F|nr:sulfotransferase family 2 domain-containing protein [Paracoccus sp. S-4012]